MKRIIYFLVPLLMTIATFVYFFNVSDNYSLYSNLKYALDTTIFINPIDNLKSIIFKIQSCSLDFSVDFSSAWEFVKSIFYCIGNFAVIMVNVIRIPFQFLLDLCVDLVLCFSFIFKLIGLNGFNIEEI